MQWSGEAKVVMATAPTIKNMISSLKVPQSHIKNLDPGGLSFSIPERDWGSCQQRKEGACDPQSSPSKVLDLGGGPPDGTGGPPNGSGGPPDWSGGPPDGSCGPPYGSLTVCRHVLTKKQHQACTPPLNEKIDSGNTHLQDLARWWRTSKGLHIPKISQFYWGLFEKTRFLCFYIIKSSIKRAKIEPKYP